MEQEFEIVGHIHTREGQEFIRLREGEREMRLLCSLAFSKIEFAYRDVQKWEYPFDHDPVAEEDRARLVARITDHYRKKGWDVVIDRRKFCPYCDEALARSQYENWRGGICERCGTTFDRLGRIVR